MWNWKMNSLSLSLIALSNRLPHFFSFSFSHSALFLFLTLAPFFRQAGSLSNAMCSYVHYVFYVVKN
jgi:hypothetical protein